MPKLRAGDGGANLEGGTLEAIALFIMAEVVKTRAGYLKGNLASSPL